MPAQPGTLQAFFLRGSEELRVCRHSPALFTRVKNSWVAWCHPTAGWCSVSTETRSPQPREHSRVSTCAPKEERSPQYPSVGTGCRSHRIPPAENPLPQPSFPITCFLQVHGGGCRHWRGSCRLTGGCWWLLGGWGRGPVQVLLPLLTCCILQGLHPPEETGWRAEVQRPCASWWTRRWWPAFHWAAQEEREGREGWEDLGKPSLRGIVVLGRCHHELTVVLSALPVPQPAHAAIPNFYFSLYGLKTTKDPGSWAGLNMKLLMGGSGNSTPCRTEHNSEKTEKNLEGRKGI